MAIEKFAIFAKGLLTAILLQFGFLSFSPSEMPLVHSSDCFTWSISSDARRDVASPKSVRIFVACPVRKR